MLLVLCGKSGCGKDTILRNLVENGNWTPLISSTSRPMRDGEVNGREYNFCTREAFEKKIENNEVLEYRTYNTLVGGVPDTWYYGLEKFKEPENGNLITILDLNGAKDVKRYCEEMGIDISCVYVDVPDQVREERASNRGGFDKQEWDRRTAADAVDFASEKVDAVCNAKISNTRSLDYVLGQLEGFLMIHQSLDLSGEPIELNQERD